MHTTIHRKAGRVLASLPPFHALARRAAGACALSVAVALPVGAQDTASATVRTEETTSLGIFATRYWFDAGEDRDRAEAGGFGARFSTNLGRAMRSTSAWFTRSSLGAFLVYTGEQDGVKTLHVGAELDALLLPRPIAGTLDPFVSVGVGGFRTTFTSSGLLGGGEESATDLALTPGAGVQLHLSPNISLRGDLRDVIVLGDRTTHNYEASAGISLHF